MTLALLLSTTPSRHLSNATATRKLSIRLITLPHTPRSRRISSTRSSQSPKLIDSVRWPHTFKTLQTIPRFRASSTAALCAAAAACSRSARISPAASTQRQNAKAHAPTCFCCNIVVTALRHLTIIVVCVIHVIHAFAIAALFALRTNTCALRIPLLDSFTRHLHSVTERCK